MARKVRIGVCEVAPEMEVDSAAWEELSAEVRKGAPEVFLLNELAFGPWIASGESAYPDTMRKSQDAHSRGLARLNELGAPVVLGTRAVSVEERDVNEAFVWTSGAGVLGVHTKQYFPNEEGYYEARWFQAGEPHFRVVEAGPVRVGFLICTEVMFNEHARQYGRAGAHVIAVPRAVGPGSLPRWLVAMRMAAIVSGCYVISSNRAGRDSKGQTFGGSGWVVDPSGETVAQTSSATPVVFYDVDPEHARRAQREYPCYVPELDARVKR